MFPESLVESASKIILASAFVRGSSLTAFMVTVLFYSVSSLFWSEFQHFFSSKIIYFTQLFK